MPKTVSVPPANPANLLRNRCFILLWCAYAVSAMGDHLSEMAILKTQDALNTTVDITPLNARMTFTFFVPFLMLAPVAGIMADRLPRQGLMIVADLARCLIMFFFASIIALAGSWGSWGPFLPLLPIGAFAALFSPARSALLPTLVDSRQLVRANGLISGVGVIATMAAAKIGGHLADHYDAQVAFRIDAGTFLTSAVLLFMIRAPVSWKTRKSANYPAATAPGAARLRSAAGSVAELRAGFHYARVHRHVWELLLVASLIWFCGALVNSVIPAVVRDVYHGSYASMSNYRALLGLGFILGAALISLFSDALRSEIAMTWALAGVGMAIALFAASVLLDLPGILPAATGAVAIVLAGLFAVGVMASVNSLLQRTVADRFRGRIFGVNDVCCTSALILATGSLAFPRWTRMDRWVGYILLGVAILAFAAGLLMLRVRLARGIHGRGLTFAENLNEFIAKFWWRLRRIGRSTVPREGAVIITANHTCSADPLFLHAAAPYRPIAFMVAAEYSNWPIVRFFLRLVECIPVKRDGRDTVATKHAIRHLRNGKALGIFIEGRIVPPGDEARPKDGVAMLALKTGATVIPAFISGVTYYDSIVRGLLARHRANVHFGSPVDLREFVPADAGREQLRAATAKIYAAILALAPKQEGTLREPA